MFVRHRLILIDDSAPGAAERGAIPLSVSNREYRPYGYKTIVWKISQNSVKTVYGNRIKIVTSPLIFRNLKYLFEAFQNGWKLVKIIYFVATKRGQC